MSELLKRGKLIKSMSLNELHITIDHVRERLKQNIKQKGLRTFLLRLEAELKKKAKP